LCDICQGRVCPRKIEKRESVYVIVRKGTERNGKERRWELIPLLLLLLPPPSAIVDIVSSRTNSRCDKLQRVGGERREESRPVK
jgi:hypothetical protein